MTRGKEQTEYVFGPVPSRRLGRSLGVDLVPFKTCTFDCIYCQLGLTTDKNPARKSFVPVDDVLRQLQQRLKETARPDYVTLSGSGEPTLSADLGRVITEIKRITDVPVAVLTNGSLLSEPEVRRACALADVVIPTLTSGTEAVFRRIHRPPEEFTLEHFLEGLEKFRAEFSGQLWLEVFLLAGINDSEEEVLKLKPLIERIGPDRIQLNTAVRPTADADALAVGEERMQRLCKLLGAEVIADFSGIHSRQAFEATRAHVLAMLRRRPCTAEDVARGLAIHLNEALKYIAELQAEGLIESAAKGDVTYYTPTTDAPS
ncbi:MAG: radical SAM protein [Planctomycetia bacterium]|nr:radical SAM protein [Planctomycetia bacterium]